MEKANNVNTSNSINLFKNLLSIELNSPLEYKTPFLYETWNWEGDESVLPFKWMELLKFSPIYSRYEKDQMKEYVKQNYYSDIKFDKKSFFFITNRSETAGCVYVNKIENNYTIEFVLINNNKHHNKGVEEALISLAIKRVFELNSDLFNNENKIEMIKIHLDLNTSNVEMSKLESLGFKK